VAAKKFLPLKIPLFLMVQLFISIFFDKRPLSPQILLPLFDLLSAIVLYTRAIFIAVFPEYSF